MGLQGALWQDEAGVVAQPVRRTWPRRTGLSHGSGGGSDAGGSVPVAGGSVPVAGGSVPIAAPAVPTAPLLGAKRGQVVIRSAAQYQNLRNCDLFVDLGAQDRRVFSENDADGRSEAVQEQVLDHKLRTLLSTLKNWIRRQLWEKRGSCLRVVIQSHHGRYRSVALAEQLGNVCEDFAEVVVFHMAVSRWDSSYGPVPMDTQPPPKNCYCFRPESRNAA